MAREYEAIEPALAAALAQTVQPAVEQLVSPSQSNATASEPPRWLVGTGQWAHWLLQEDEAIEPALAAACERQVDGS